MLLGVQVSGRHISPALGPSTLPSVPNGDGIEKSTTERPSRPRTMYVMMLCHAPAAAIRNFEEAARLSSSGIETKKVGRSK